jgi:hypothetical protein
MKYDRELFTLQEKEYQPKKRLEKLAKETLVRKEKEYHKVDLLERSVSVLKAPQKVFDRTQSFEWDLFQLADYEFVRWANEQPANMVIAIMAELKKCPKMKPSIEVLRPKVSSIPLCSIELYRKKKRLGERSVDFLKQMKKRYGNSVLRILFVTSES